MTAEANRPNPPLGRDDSERGRALRFGWAMKDACGRGPYSNSPSIILFLLGVFFVAIVGLIYSLGFISLRLAWGLGLLYYALWFVRIIFRVIRAHLFLPHLLRFNAVRYWRQHVHAKAKYPLTAGVLHDRVAAIGADFVAPDAFADFMNRYDKFEGTAYSYPDKRKPAEEAERWRERALDDLAALKKAMPAEWTRLVNLEPLSDHFLRRGLPLSSADDIPWHRLFRENLIPHFQCWLASARGWSDEEIHARLGSAFFEKKLAAWVDPPMIVVADSARPGPGQPSPLGAKLEAPLKQHHHSIQFVMYYGMTALALMIVLRPILGFSAAWTWFVGLLFAYTTITFMGLSSPYGSATRRDVPWLIFWYAAAAACYLIPLGLVLRKLLQKYGGG